MAIENPVTNMRDVALVTSVFGAVLTSFAAQQTATLVFGSVICLVYGIWANRRQRVDPTVALFVLPTLLLFMPAFFKPYFGLTPPYYVATTLANILAAIAITRHSPHTLLLALRTLFALSIAGVGVALYVFWDLPEPLGEVIEGSSTNGIPSYIIVLQVGLSLSNYLVLKRLPLLSPVITCVVAFFGYGRGSLVVAIAILVSSILLGLLLVKRDDRVSLLTLTMLLIASVAGILTYADDITFYFEQYTKLGAGLADMNRLEIWRDYLANIDAWTILVGADYTGTVIERERAGNPHIAYIRTHAFFGLPVTLLAILSPAMVLLSRKSIRSKLVFVVFLSSAALRAVSEPILFPTLLDFLYFSYLFMFFRYAPLARSIGPNSSEGGSCYR